MKKILSLGLLVVLGAFLVQLDCGGPQPDKVTGITATGTTNGEGITLSWNAVTDAESYNVYFEDELVKDGITTTSYEHSNPGKVGSYIVTAQIGGQEGPDSDPFSSAPIAVADMEVWELNGTGFSGIGFNISGNTVDKYSMASGDFATKIDCYFTNWLGLSDGFGGQYSLASPDQVPDDPGDPVPGFTDWRTSGISDGLGGGIETVTSAPALGSYKNYTDVTVNETYAVSTQDNYFGLVQPTAINTTTGAVQIKATFQPIKAFRLFK